jgi:hypothetical protein
MTTFQQVISMLIPNGGYVTNGDTYEGIQFLEATPITKEQFEAGFAQYDTWKAEQDAAKAHERAALLERLGITEDEARLLLGGN